MKNKYFYQINVSRNHKYMLFISDTPFNFYYLDIFSTIEQVFDAMGWCEGQKAALEAVHVWNERKDELEWQ